MMMIHRYLLFSLVISSLVLDLTRAQSNPSDSILTITSSNIENALEKYEYLFLQFYTAQCSVCQGHLHEYPEIVKKVQLYNRLIGFGKVDGDKEKALVEKYEAQRYPFFLLVTKEGPIEYTGGKTIKEVVNWIKKQTTHIVEAVAYDIELQRFRKEYEVVFLYFGAFQGNLYNNYAFTAKYFVTDSTMTFLATESAELKAKYNIEKEGEILNFKMYDNEPSRLVPPYDPTGLYDFVQNNQYPDIKPFSPKIAELVFGHMNTSIFLFTGRRKSYEAAQNEFIAAKDEIKESLSLVLVDITDSLGRRVFEYLGVGFGELPAVMLEKLLWRLNFC